MRGFLGVNIQDLTSELAKEFAAPDTKGALIGNVEAKGAAAEGGDILIDEGKAK
jgi:S1-C subfamily serine protease